MYERTQGGGAYPADGTGAGFNVIGHLSTSSGLGNTARLFISVLRNQGYGIAAIDVDYDGNTEREPIEGVQLCTSTNELPYRHNLIIVSLIALPSLWLNKLPSLLDARFRNVGLIFWELPIIPRAWHPSLALFDAILVSSPFVRHAVEIAVPEVPTFHAEHPLLPNRPDRDRTAVRAARGIPASAFVCCTSFDLRSDHSRKNPEGVVDAFRRAFPHDADVRLVIKTNNASSRPSTNARANALMMAISEDPRIMVMAGTMSYADVLSLYSACDVYLSLHRAEGLGLGPMEAMSLGKLVIATGYSGNMAYMSELNSIPIAYRLVEPLHVTWQYTRSFAGSSASWAEPDIEQAALALKRAHETPSLVESLSRRAAKDIEERQTSAWAGSYLVQLAATLEASDRFALRHGLAREVRMMEFTDAVLRKLNTRIAVEKARSKARDMLSGFLR